MSRQSISSGTKFEADIAYSRAVVVDGWIFVSGTTGYKPSGEISEDVVEQTEQTLLNIERALQEAGSSSKDIVRVRYLLPNRNDFEKTWPVLRRWFGDVRPAATMEEVKLMKEEMKIEIEVTARKATEASR
ncbi:hypothetical protein S40285_01527 [Stachybotrys chlorohalonatus IBT 40285]|uniref:Uncharacterized protein n=1 Tax=Stachybotrys chlorohalonatus (strain IBT 40285) TaxID=1283841 RepID=A0A084QMN4_STAC4|nr:hypothetical protein S40285_01527 [Stachybotrys chlorohalonata IBT 40285]